MRQGSHGDHWMILGGLISAEAPLPEPLVAGMAVMALNLLLI
ncbi:hypothetical protein [Thiorhodovibrio winogradskyi]|nr:hypothetical protein [Thiorhodovibrio winogradskyi]